MLRLWCCSLLGLTQAQSYAASVASSLLAPFEANLNASFESIFNSSQITKKVLGDFLQPLEVVVARNAYVTRDGPELKLNGQKWMASGANVYWLGLDENVHPPAGQPFYQPYNASYPTKGRITEVMNTLATMGARTIRSQTLGISVGNPLSLEPDLGVFNEEAFDTIDWAVYQAREHGIRIMAPLIDNYDYYHGGKYVFLRWRGLNISTTDGYSKVDPRIMQFYTNVTIISDFKQYIHKLITHVNPYTGLSYAADPTIFAYETGNELGGPVFGDMWVPNSWTSEIASYVKSLAPHKLIVDGTYGVNKTHFSVSSIDIFSDHYYPLNVTKLSADISLVKSANRVYLAGEYDWTGNVPANKSTGASSLSQFYSAIESQAAKSPSVIAGDLFWSLFMHDVPNCNTFVNHTDGYELQYGNPLNTMQNDTQIGIIRKHFWKLNHNETVSSYLPAVACPGPTAEYTYV